ncbi:MAG TPA: hypothetical protein VEL03_08750 [Streptosporangiaceae bacterium]|nr:hypothetical protein [Streptosporangiaceae bacterium]
MRFPWSAKEYARTCAECGYTWRVPRSAARRRVSSISVASVASPRSIDRAELARELTAMSADKQRIETFRHCPRCGAEHFTQQPVRGGMTG